MAFKSGIFNSINGDRKYKAEDFASYFATFISNGVFPNPSDGLQVISNNNMTISVRPGKGWIYGYYVTNDADYTFNIDVADGILKRIDRVVLQLSYSTRQIVPVVKKGAFASTPVAPVVQRDADIYELVLADILVSNGVLSITQTNITDQRLNTSLCGIVHGLVSQVDTTTIFNQYQSWYNTYTASKQTEFDSWKTNQQNAYLSWTTDEQNLFLSWMTGQQNSFTSWQSDQQSSFIAWYNGVKNILSGDVAANLSNQISSHISDYVAHPGFATTTNSGNAYSVSLSPAPISYVDGMGVVIRPNANSTGATTININGLGAKALKKANGNDVVTLKNISIYTFRYNATAGYFVLQGDRGEYETAQQVGAIPIGTIDSDVSLVNSLLVDASTRSTEITRDASGVITSIVEKSGSTVVRTITINRTNAVLISVVEIVGGKTITITINRDASNRITSVTKTIA